MKIRFAHLCLVIYFGLIGGCATPLAHNQVRVTFESEPAGAAIYWGSTAYGTAPQTLTFDLSDDAVRRGWQLDDNLRVVWPSGAERRGITLNMAVRDSVLRYSRPADAPGLERDLAWALQLGQARNAGISGTEALLLLSGAAAQGYAQGRQSTTPAKPTSPQTVTCRTDVARTGTSAQTTCTK